MASHNQRDASERSPLLHGAHAVNGGIERPAEQSRSQPRAVDEPYEVVLVEEPSTKKKIAIMGSMWIGVFCAALDSTIVATLSAPISSSFDSLNLLSWLATGYLIANSACQPLSGKLTDIFSRRYGLLFSNIFFAVGTLICGLAPNAPTIIAGRVIAGIGGGGLNCISTFVSSDLIPLRRRGVWQGYGNIIFGLGMGVGGVFGGICADKLTWRWAFLLQIPFIVVSAVLVWFLVDIPVNPSTKPALSRVDFLGSLMLVLTIVLLLLGLNTGGNQLPWSHPLVITSLALSFVSLILFLYIESNPRLAPEPVIPVRLIARTRTIFAACLTNWFSTMTSFTAMYYVPLYLQIRAYSASEAGLRVVPFAFSMSIGSLSAGFIMRATGRYYILLCVMMTILIAGAALLCTFTAQTPAWATFIYITPLGLGYGSMLTITLVAMISAADHAFQAVITASSYAFRSTGSTIGITIASAVYTNILTRQLLDEYPGQDDQVRKVRSSLEGLLKDKLPKGWDKDVVMDCYMDALRGAFIAALGFAVLSGVCALLMREHILYKNLDRKPSDARRDRGEDDNENGEAG